MWCVQPLSVTRRGASCGGCLAAFASAQPLPAAGQLLHVGRKAIVLEPDGVVEQALRKVVVQFRVGHLRDQMPDLAHHVLVGPIELPLSRHSVSYTHLTLPTIYS